MHVYIFCLFIAYKFLRDSYICASLFLLIHINMCFNHIIMFHFNSIIMCFYVKIFAEKHHEVSE